MDNNIIVANGALLVTLVALASRELFSWLKEKNLQNTDNKIYQMNDSIKTIDNRVEKIDMKIDNLVQSNKTMYDWHDKNDEDGVKIWYVRRSLEEALQENVKAINILAKNSEVQTRLLEDMVKQNKEISKDQMILSKLLERLIDKQ
jgi:hypothetical protein